MKIVSLNRLNEIENELRKQFPKEEFKFNIKLKIILVNEIKTW
ncbi:hydroxyacid dehydrogenase, partial [Staphylococcus epidermidis]|nr:hydroxyacid dehydrogenase [Staphylococcus epidermidis]